MIKVIGPFNGFYVERLTRGAGMKGSFRNLEYVELLAIYFSAHACKPTLYGLYNVENQVFMGMGGLSWSLA